MVMGMKTISIFSMDICDNISGKSFCPLGDAATSSITSSIKLFREEYEYHVREGRCMVGREAAMVAS